MRFMNTQEHYIVKYNNRVSSLLLLVFACIFLIINYPVYIGDSKYLYAFYASLLLNSLIFFSNFFYKLEVNNGNVVYVNHWGKKTKFHMSDISDFKFNDKNTIVWIYKGDKKIARLHSGLSCYDFFVNDLRKYYIAEVK